MKTRLTLLAAAVLTLGTAAVVFVPAVRADDAKAPATSQPAAATNAKCPITGEDVDPKITTVYDGKTYAFCCGDCVASFKKDPAKYAAKAK